MELILINKQNKRRDFLCLGIKLIDFGWICLKKFDIQTFKTKQSSTKVMPKQSMKSTTQYKH